MGLTGLARLLDEGRDHVRVEVGVGDRGRPDFESLGIPVLARRGFESGDGAPGRHVAVLSRSAAERHWPGEDPIGQRFLADHLRPLAPYAHVERRHAM